MSSSVLSHPSYANMDDNRNTTIRPDNFSDTSSNSIPTTPALPKEHRDLLKKDNNNNSTTFVSEDVDNYATAEHVAAWLPLDDPPKDNNTSNHDILIDAIPPLPAKATRLPAPAAIWKTWDSPTLLPWGNDSIWMSSNKQRRFSTSLPPALLPSATPTSITTPKRRTSVTTLSSSSMPYHRRSSFPDTVLSTTDQSKKDYWQSLVSGDLDRPLYTKTDAAFRRYSSPSCAAAAASSSSSMCHQDPPLSPELMQRIDDYFSSTPSMSNRMNAGSLAASMSSMTASEVQNMGKGVPLLELLHDDTVTLFTVELAPGRQDIYYMQHDENHNEVVKEGDLVIVEADRGQDMGQVKGVFAKTTTKDDDDDDDGDDNNTTCIRRLYRLATREEIATLPTKAQDEAKALLVCQSKIKERELPMQVLRAEYQWDRRKLTFHFTAEERVDFRELVRELFKLYKTRIWMCAINNKHHHHSSSFSS